MFARIAIVCLVLASAWAQAPQGAALLDQARSMHGGTALSGLSTYRERANYVYYSGGRELARAEATTVYDLSGQRYRIELRRDGRLLSIDQTTPQGSVAWSPARGPSPLPEFQAKELRDMALRGWISLRFGRERDQIEGPTSQTYQGLPGLEVKVRTRGLGTAYLLSPQGVLLAERNSQTGVGEVTTLYDDYRAVGDLRVPFRSRGYTAQGLFVTVEVLEAQANPALSAAAFALP